MKNLAQLILLLAATHATAQDVDFAYLDTSLPIDRRVDCLVSQMTLEEKVGQLVNAAGPIDRLMVPAYDWWNEALHGVARNGKATIFPQGIGLGATFDPELAWRVASAISTEARAKYAVSQRMGNYGKYAGLTFWTPNINIFRDPRWGRGQETYGEDPYLTSRIGVAFVRGLQGDDPRYLKSAACAKHFAVHSGPEEIRHQFDARPSMKDLYETYLPAFEALVKEARVEGVMAAYNAVDGTPACANRFLLTDLLRTEWGFDGYVVSDCGAVGGIAWKQHYVKTGEEAAAAALAAGVNLNCGNTFDRLAKALEQGLVTEELIDERTRQLFKTRFRLGMFDFGEGSNPYGGIGPETIHCEAHVRLAREVARKSIVLLKNRNNLLPLPKEVRVPYVTGPFANSCDMLMGNYYGVSPGMVTILEGVTDAVSLGSSLNYRSGALPFQKNLNPKNWAPHVAAESDVTICVVGITADMEGEEVDAIAAEHMGDRKDLRLPQNQIDYIRELVQFKKGPLVLVIASGSPVSMEEFEDDCDAILQIWYPGEQGGNAVADILFGAVSPSGRLPITFPRNIGQLPPYEDYGMRGRTYKFMREEPLFPFGFGLSYTTFKYGDMKVDRTVLSKGAGVGLSCSVANTGTCDADDIVQLYLAPVGDDADTARYILKRFMRVSLAAGERKTVDFKLSANDLLMVDKEGERVWMPGDYRLVIANALPSERSLALGAARPVETLVHLESGGSAE